MRFLGVSYLSDKKKDSRFSFTISRCFHSLAVFVQPGEATISTKFSVSCVSKDFRLVTSAEFARRTLKHFSASRFLAIAVYLYSFSEVLTIRPGVVDSIDYFRIPHNTLCLPPKFCITYCLKMLLGKCNTPRSI